MNTLSQSLISASEYLMAFGGEPTITDIILPPILKDNHCRDQFGFVILNDYYVGPFYVSLGESLNVIWQQFGNSKENYPKITTLLDGFNHKSLDKRSLALGAYNALSHRYFIANPDYLRKKKFNKNPHFTSVGMVGHFDPMIERYLAQGISVTLLEKNRDRIVTCQGLKIIDTATSLQNCDYIICTASTIINDSLEEILAATPNSTVHLLGPSASGFGDPYFKIGVDLIGGTLFRDAATLKHALDNSEHFASAGEKYNITRE